MTRPNKHTFEINFDSFPFKIFKKINSYSFLHDMHEDDLCKTPRPETGR